MDEHGCDNDYDDVAPLCVGFSRDVYEATKRFLLEQNEKTGLCTACGKAAMIAALEAVSQQHADDLSRELRNYAEGSKPR